MFKNVLINVVGWFFLLFHLAANKITAKVTFYMSRYEIIITVSFYVTLISLNLKLDIPCRVRGKVVEIESRSEGASCRMPCRVRKEV